MELPAGQRNPEAYDTFRKKMNFKLFDFVRLKRDIPLRNLRRGMAGTIIEVFDKPNRAYEVEFSDDNGVTIAQLALQPDEIDLIRPHSP